MIEIYILCTVFLNFLNYHRRISSLEKSKLTYYVDTVSDANSIIWLCYTFIILDTCYSEKFIQIEYCWHLVLKTLSNNFPNYRVGLIKNITKINE